MSVEAVEFFKWVGGLGVGGALAYGIFLAYRKDVKSYTDLWERTATMLIVALEKSTAAHVENSATNREMVGLLRAVHKRLDSDELRVTERERKRELRLNRRTSDREE
jgi:hypothetical protein